MTAADDMDNAPSDSTAVATAVSGAVHESGFNIFNIPFINFNASVDIGTDQIPAAGAKEFLYQSTHDGQPAIVPGYVWY